MKKIRAIDVPEDLIEQLAERLQVDNAMAADLLACLANVVADAVVDFDAERYLRPDATRHRAGIPRPVRAREIATTLTR
jgi:hypothetical protein